MLTGAGEAPEPKPAAGFQRVLQRAAIHVQSSGREEVTGANVLVAIFSERESYAVYFLHQQDAPNGIYKVHVGAAVTISNQEYHEYEANFGVRAGASNVKGGVNKSGSYSGKVTAYKLYIDLGNRRGHMRYETNRATNHLIALKNLGKDARLVRAVWIFVQGDESQSDCYSGDLTVSNGAYKVSTSGSSCSTSSWTIPAGSIFAYEMAKVTRWDKNELQQRPTCPSGYKLETRSSPATPMDRCVKTTFDTSGVKCKLAPTDNRSNWYVQARDGRDTCKSRKGKKDKSVTCSKSGHDYVAQKGKDKCQKAKETYRDPSCPRGYDYNKKSTSDGGKDMCELEGIQEMTVDSKSALSGL